MKISEFRTEKAADVLLEILPFVTEIVTDAKLCEELANAVDIKGKTAMEVMAVGVAKFAKLIPLVLKNHKEDVFGIIAVLNCKTVDEVRKQNIVCTMEEIKELVHDKELIDFFRSCMDSEGGE